MRGIVYRMKFARSTLDINHGNSFYSIELYIPSLNLSFNTADGYSHCFQTDKDRYVKAKIIKKPSIPDSIAYVFEEYFQALRGMNAVKHWFDNSVYAFIPKTTTYQTKPVKPKKGNKNEKKS